MDIKIIGFTYHKLSSCYYHINYQDNTSIPLFYSEIKYNTHHRYIISYDITGKLLACYPEEIIGKNTFKYTK